MSEIFEVLGLLFLVTVVGQNPQVNTDQGATPANRTSHEDYPRIKEYVLL